MIDGVIVKFIGGNNADIRNQVYIYFSFISLSCIAFESKYIPIKLLIDNSIIRSFMLGEYRVCMYSLAVSVSKIRR